MRLLTDAERAAVITEARTWIGTRYHHAARIKHSGVDCAQLLCGVYEGAGVTKRIETPQYPPDWHLHRNAERYVGELVKYTREIELPSEGMKPADIISVRFGRTFSHAAIVIEWPICIHAYLREPVCMVDVLKDHRFVERAKRYFVVEVPE